MNIEYEDVVYHPETDSTTFIFVKDLDNGERFAFVKDSNEYTEYYRNIKDKTPCKVRIKR